MGRKLTIIILALTLSIGFSFAIERNSHQSLDLVKNDRVIKYDQKISQAGMGESLRPNQYGYKNYGFENQPKKTSDNVDYDQHEIVKNVQRRLMARGYKINSDNGVMDQSTSKALSKFQAKQGIDSTGRVNQATLEALKISIMPETSEGGIYSE